MWESWFWMFGCFWEYVIYYNYVIKHILEWEWVTFTYVDVFWESCFMLVFLNICLCGFWESFHWLF